PLATGITAGIGAVVSGYEQCGIVDLIAMTPMQFRTSKDFQEQVSQLDQLCVTADFRVDLFRKD
ncbi:MAG: hypothetical protein AAFN93_23090, partial [Bacteroidota bacterium]